MIFTSVPILNPSSYYEERLIVSTLTFREDKLTLGLSSNKESGKILKDAGVRN